MITFIASAYQNRELLEEAIATQCGKDIEVNTEAGHKVTGTEQELRDRGLSVTTSIYGVKCEIE